jgi:ribonuclease E
MRLWEQVRELALKSFAPAPIYEEGDLIKRSIRDLYNREIEEVLVEGEAGYRTAKDFMRMIMPVHAKQVIRYDEPMPLFARYQVESYLGGMFNPTVQLKSGGYIVIGITEALVAIDVNSGRSTREGSIEDTALKTNLEAAEEVARQLRLRDLAGLIVIDFIDMEERKNNAAVEKRLKDKLKTDRARIQVGRISGFGLMEMSRQRLRPGMLESTTQPCAHCHGTGLIRSDDSLALTILRALEEEGTRKRSKEVLLRAPVAVVNFLMNQKREHIALIEQRYGMSVRIEADPSLVSPDYSIEKFKTAIRVVPEAQLSVISGNASMMGAAVDEDEDDLVEDEIDEVEEAEEVAEAEEQATVATPAAAEGNGQKKKRRRRRRRKPGAAPGDLAGADGAGEDGAEDGSDDEGADDDTGADEADAADAAADAPAAADLPAEAEAAPAVKPKRTRAPRKPKAEAAEVAETAVEVDEAAVKPKTRSRSRKPKAVATEAAPDTAETVVSAAQEPQGMAPVDASASAEPPLAEPAGQPQAETPAMPAPVVVEEPVAVTVETPAEAETPTPAAEPELAAAEGEPKPKRKGWWSQGR